MKFHPKENAQSKSYQLALRIVETCREIQHTKREFILTKQLIRSGTSVGANLQEAIGRQSDKDLLHKLFIAYKEARETKYWLSLLSDLKYLSSIEFEELENRVDELLRILGASISTLKKKV